MTLSGHFRFSFSALEINKGEELRLHTCDKTRRSVVVVPLLRGGGRRWDRHVAVAAGRGSGLRLEMGEGLGTLHVALLC